MDKATEACIFQRLWGVFDGEYFLSHLADPSWPSFFKVEAGRVLLCATEKVGWCTEAPGEVKERLEHISITADGRANYTLHFDGRHKQLTVNSDRVQHYYGR
ncbi:hypothetical protein [Gallaecimonas mangrovi]|uniref:hypothetical protein n=1 Tax=Gallaecimonas mangrovi TaxID=2291597 RepID=UPI000E1FD7C9|nr:hypothetical protein [Gallaecimonas mangrovi]